MTMPKRILIPFTAEALLADMKPGIAHACHKLAHKCGVSTPAMREFMNALEAAGQVEGLKSIHGAMAFQLKDRKVQPPYVNLRLDEDLVGYNSTLRSHERLAMLTRR
jgi:hypothetical protein